MLNCKLARTNSGEYGLRFQQIVAKNRFLQQLEGKDPLFPFHEPMHSYVHIRISLYKYYSERYVTFSNLQSQSYDFELNSHFAKPITKFAKCFIASRSSFKVHRWFSFTLQLLWVDWENYEKLQIISKKKVPLWNLVLTMIFIKWNFRHSLRKAFNEKPSGEILISKLHQEIKQLVRIKISIIGWN